MLNFDTFSLSRFNKCTVNNLTWRQQTVNLTLKKILVIWWSSTGQLRLVASVNKHNFQTDSSAGLVTLKTKSFVRLLGQIRWTTLGLLLWISDYLFFTIDKMFPPDLSSVSTSSSEFKSSFKILVSVNMQPQCELFKMQIIDI